MTRTRDAMGRLLLDYYNCEDVAEIVEREDGYIESGKLGPALYLAEYKDWLPFEKEAIKFARGRILDIGCGAGRVGLYLQKKGHEVVGIDNSPLAVRVSRKRGLKKVIVMSVTGLNSGLGIFDTLIMYGNNFGLMGSYKRARWLLKRFYNITSDRGRIIAQTLDPYKTDKKEYKKYHRYNRKRGRMGGQVRIRIRHRNIIGEWFDYLLVSKKEMLQILEGTGWRVNRFIDSNGPIYIAVIDKMLV